MPKNNEQIISTLLNAFSNDMEDKRLGIFLELSVARILMKTNDSSLINPITLTIQLNHIIDWFKASIINNAQWISNVDELGRPKKIMKFSSIEQIVSEADKYMNIANQKLSNVQLIEGDEELFKELENGYYIVKLLTPAALDRESSQMQHCIGQGSYDKKLKNKDYLYLSLRNSSGKAHTTIEILKNMILQLQGKQNKMPNKKYLDILIPFLKDQKYGLLAPIDNLKYAIDINNNWHEFDKIPDNTTFDMNLNITSEVDDFILPKNLTLTNNCSLTLDKINIKNLPEGLIVDGSLTIIGTQLTNFPDDIKVRSLYIYDSNVSEIPNYITEYEYLYLDNTNVNSIPNCVKYIKHDLNIQYSNIKSLPDYLQVDGTLTLNSNHNIPSLIGLQVRTFVADETRIEELPDDIVITHRMFVNSYEGLYIPDGVRDSARIHSLSEPAISGSQAKMLYEDDISPKY